MKIGSYNIQRDDTQEISTTNGIKPQILKCLKKKKLTSSVNTKKNTLGTS